MSLTRILQLAEKFAQKVGAEPAQVENTLKRARLWGTPSLVSPLLERAGVPPHTTVDIKLQVSPISTATLQATMNPNHGSVETLNSLLNARYAKLMTDALQNANLIVNQPMNFGWLQITRLGQ